MLTKEQRAVLDKNDLGNYDNEEVGPTDAWAIFNLYKGAIEELADTRLQLAEARRDAERIAWAIERNMLMFGDVSWYHRTQDGSWQAFVLKGEPVVLPPEARSIIDAARAAEEKTT